MLNLILGITTILFCLILLTISWKFYKNEKFFHGVIFIMLCGFILRLFVSSDPYLHTWDERYHALVAKNLIKHPLTPTLYDNPLLPYNYKSWDSNHIWLHKQPFPLWTIALSIWFFGINEISIRIPSIVLTTIGIYLTFRLGRFFFNKRVGYFAAFLYSINGLIIEMTGGRVATDHVDIFFLFLIELSIFFTTIFLLKKKCIYNIFVGITLGAAILTKWLPALIVIPIWIILVIDSKVFNTKFIYKQLGLVILSTLLVCLPWQIYIYSSFPKEAIWETYFNFRHITETLEGHSGNFFYFLNQIRINYGEIVYIPIIWFSWKSLNKFRNRNFIVILIWFLIPFIFFSFVKTKMEGYILFSAPAIFLINAKFFVFIKEQSIFIKYKWIKYLLVFLLIALPIRYCIERTKPFRIYERNQKWKTDLLKIKYEKGVLFNYNRPIEAMFYTNLIVYPYIPDSIAIVKLQKEGYPIFINNSIKLPYKINLVKGTTILSLEED